ncbi:MAG: hypothetical protein Q8O75_00055 [bacterium]|nr:hypothetical protein [bacterium]
MGERNRAGAGEKPVEILEKLLPFLQGLIEVGLNYKLIVGKLTEAGMKVEETDVQDALNRLRYAYGDLNTGLTFAVRAGYFHNQLDISRASKLDDRDLANQIKRVLVDKQIFAIWMGTVEGLMGSQIGESLGLSGDRVRHILERRLSRPLKTNRYGLVALGLEVKGLEESGKLRVEK